MAQTHSLGKFYWQKLVYPIKPKVVCERAETQEIDTPYRFGKAVAIRLPFTRLALVLGFWVAQYSESQALTNAINGRIMKQDEVDWDYVRFGEEDVI